MKYIVAVALFVILSMTASSQENKESIITKALASRRSLPSQYHLLLTRSTSIKSAGNPAVQSTEISVWSKKGLLRTDVVKKSSSFDSDGVGWREIVCRNCERAGYAVRTRAGGGVSLSMVNFIRIDAAFDGSDEWRIDWRGLGLLQDALDGYAKKPYSDTIDVLGQRAATAAEVKALNGFPCLTLTSAAKGEVRLTRTCWFRPDLGMNPVVIEDAVEGVDFKQRSEIDYRKLDKLGLWFPSSVHYTRTQNGETILDEKLSVLLADFETPVPDETFTLAGLSLDNSQPVALPEITQSKDYPTWRGGKLDRTYTAGKMALEAHEFRAAQSDANPPVPDRLAPRWPYYVGASILAVAGLALVAAARKSRRRSAS